MEYTISLITGYLIGSVPFAYLLLRRSKGIDITKSGTGNVGAMNAYEITNSKFLGVLILILDLLKGVLSVYIPIILFQNDFTYSALGLLGAVFSHCFNPWLQFKGGRGLATAAGGIVILFPIILLVWLILWAIVYYWSNDIHLGNVASSFLSLIVMFNIAEISYTFAYPRPDSINDLVLFSTGLFMLVLSKHIEPLKELIKKPEFLKWMRRR